MGAGRSSRGFAIGAVLVAALGGACGRSPVAPEAPDSSAAGGTANKIANVAATVAQAAAAVSGQDAPAADEYAAGRHLGFDTHTYPGDKVMLAWKTAPDAPYSWVGFYLPAPCHRDRSWSGKRQTLKDMGWGIAVIYVGQQTWGRTPRSLSATALAALARQTSCSADLLSAARGTADANDAIAKATAEGFVPGTVVFLDIEHMDRVPEAMRDYYRAWVGRMLADGRYRPGVYAQKANAELIHADVAAVYAAAHVTGEPRFWIAGGRDFAPDKAPTEVGQPFAGVWQGVLDAVNTVADIALPVDVSISAWQSPSESGTAP